MQPMTHEKLEEAVTALAEGRFEALTPDQMAEVEAHVNTCDSCAAGGGGSRTGRGRRDAAG